MSSGHVLTSKERDIWQKRIINLCTHLYMYNYYMDLCYFIVQLYEYCVACEATDEHLPIKLKQLSRSLQVEGWSEFCSSLYSCRCKVTYDMYRTDINFGVVFDNPLYSSLVDKYFDEEYRVYLQVLRSSYMSCLQEDYLL